MESYNMEYLKNLYFHEDSGCLQEFIVSHTRIPATSPSLPFLFGSKTGFPTAPYSQAWPHRAHLPTKTCFCLFFCFSCPFFIMAIIKHTGILPHMTTICHTQLHMQHFVFSSAFLVVLLAMQSTKLVLRHDPLHDDNY